MNVRMLLLWKLPASNQRVNHTTIKIESQLLTQFIKTIFTLSRRGTHQLSRDWRFKHTKQIRYSLVSRKGMIRITKKRYFLVILIALTKYYVEFVINVFPVSRVLSFKMSKRQIFILMRHCSPFATGIHYCVVKEIVWLFNVTIELN